MQTIEASERGDDSGLRILLLLPTQRDTQLAARVLREEGMAATECRDDDALRDALREPAGAVFIAEEWLTHGAHAFLADILARQPAWSDLPVVVVARSNSDSVQLARLLDTLGNASMLERPARVAALTSAARTALRARQRQYQIRAQLEDLERARAELDAAARRKDEFLAMLGHELRNPLAPIRNAIEVLLREEQQPRSRTMLGMMRRQVDHMVRLVEDLVDVARLTQGTIELRLQPTSIPEVLQSAIALSRPLVESGGHALDIDIPEDALLAMADSTRLSQVFSNLLNNAAKYSSPNGAIRLSLLRDGNEAVVRVADRGIGIEPAMLPRIFELFTQGRHLPHHARGGLGIGLTLVRSLVRMHNGVIEARSDGPGQGSEFTVRLPLLRNAVARNPVRAPDLTVPGALRVLVVDDNVDAAETMGLLLGVLGVEHAIAFDGADALRRVDGAAPDAVLLDLGMPGMDGFEVARRIRARHPEVALVALTGWSQAEDVARTRAAGFSEHLSKPVSPAALTALLRRLRAKGA
ncbi:Histidine kinase [Lysobacter dokdonensis DS-58]|uniref:histidine kinase n=1 Tax=Lysobacter dokdonensis DS-58 TaxID=1300345 RepID=A0A0A2WDD3_9GAMM|nr:ATP-binding protein [Lysobacter dokdonensis]KGQ18211.1 Histidine kinase [Lysobacter dokdonensis DS-58]